MSTSSVADMTRAIDLVTPGTRIYFTESTDKRSTGSVTSHQLGWGYVLITVRGRTLRLSERDYGRSWGFDAPLTTLIQSVVMLSRRQKWTLRLLLLLLMTLAACVVRLGYAPSPEWVASGGSGALRQLQRWRSSLTVTAGRTFVM